MLFAVLLYYRASGYPQAQIQCHVVYHNVRNPSSVYQTPIELCWRHNTARALVSAAPVLTLSSQIIALYLPTSLDFRNNKQVYC